MEPVAWLFPFWARFDRPLFSAIFENPSVLFRSPQMQHPCSPCQLECAMVFSAVWLIRWQIFVQRVMICIVTLQRRWNHFRHHDYSKFVQHVCYVVCHKGFVPLGHIILDADLRLTRVRRDFSFILPFFFVLALKARQPEFSACQRRNCSDLINQIRRHSNFVGCEIVCDFFQL